MEYLITSHRIIIHRGEDKAIPILIFNGRQTFHVPIDNKPALRRPDRTQPAMTIALQQQSI